ncbi:hypothetical protein AWM75_04990 [Aerococcus urinaehominis]|uniref:Uncharacterized protein n=1 Tax=Aerococcus urinaehominis TaxID=128944 RepID=A0A120IAW8_9LACT|nr:class A sortase [Aerococcus urinaehominis]AMB99386.1 hypothetical protein AWM75_04990 [Aerococcus urinaehominis]SDM23360.1 sortase A [Aerococcus urinaehominis]
MAKQKKSGRFNWQTLLGIILILVAVVLLALEPIQNYMLNNGIENNRVENLTRQDIVQAQQAEVTYDFSDVNPLDPRRVIADQADASQLPTVGALAIPDLGMNLPIYKGVSDAGMYFGAGTLKADQAMGQDNYAIASHHSAHEGMLFEPLMRAQVGQTVYLTDLKNIYVYEIDRVEEVDPSRVDVIENNGRDMLTMITCTFDLANRVVVQANHVDTVAIDQATTEMLDAFNINQNIPD